MIFIFFQFLYKNLVNIKNTLYDRNFFSSLQLPVPVISIGNLSVGGTGKTPCVEYLVRELQTNFKKISIISRSYKGQLHSPKKVDLTMTNAALVFGDEPCYLQKKLPQCQVWAGPQKSLTAAHAFNQSVPDLFIIDDGFSHRKLRRNFDLVLIDALAPDSEMDLLPVGRFREPWSELKRASAVVITKSNLVSTDRQMQLKEMIQSQGNINSENIFFAQSVLQVKELEPKDNLFVFCGLGQPNSFKKSLEAANFNILNFRTFPDHHFYSKNELDKIMKTFIEARDDIKNLKLVVTEKDFVKIENHPIAAMVIVLGYSMTISPNEKGTLIEKISHGI